MAQYVCTRCGTGFEAAGEGTAAPLCANCRKIIAPGAVARIGTGGSLPVLTLGLIAVNVAVYIAMIASGASWISPTSTDALRFGADFGPLTLNGQWWRLFTSMFVHFGIIHIGLNMWCLWSLGDLAERVMSRKAFLFLYIASGLAGNIVSELWNPSRVSAGASGAVFGAAGGLVAFIYLKKAPISMEYATRRLKSLGIFIVYNLVYGMKAGVDNAAHIGGVLSGLAIGAVIPAMIAGSFGKAAGSEGGGGEVASAPVPPPLGGGNAAESRLWLVMAATAVILGLGAYAAAHYGQPKIAAQRADFLNDFQNDSAALIPVLEKRVLQDSQDFAGFALLGEAHLFADDPKVALVPLQKAIGIVPESASTHHNLALAYIGSGDFASADKEIARAGGKGDAGAVEFMLGLTADGQGHPDAALAHFQKAEAARADIYQAMFGEALTKLELGKVDEAQAVYERILAQRSFDTRAKAAMAQLKTGKVKSIGDFNPPEVAIPYGVLMELPVTWPYVP